MRNVNGPASALTLLLPALLVLLHPAGGSVAGREQPTAATDSVQVNAFTFDVYRKNCDVWSWVPRMEFRVKGPIPSGGQLYTEFTLPGAGPWVKFDCKTEETQAGHAPASAAPAAAPGVRPSRSLVTLPFAAPPAPFATIVVNTTGDGDNVDAGAGCDADGGGET